MQSNLTTYTTVFKRRRSRNSSFDRSRIFATKIAYSSIRHMLCFKIALNRISLLSFNIVGNIHTTYTESVKYGVESILYLKPQWSCLKMQN